MEEEERKKIRPSLLALIYHVEYCVTLTTVITDDLMGSYYTSPEIYTTT
ncbi:hypothetical protein Leryth_017496 [Lithospermum erythrorhizon]|nr:hypothetical protein Leryth_017496 [Lithospermum erythrorhizon]